MPPGFGRCFGGFLFLVVVMPTPFAQAQGPLTPAEQEIARNVETASIFELKRNPTATFLLAKGLPKLRETSSGREGKSFIVQINGVKLGGDSDRRSGLVIRYDYPTGLTFRSLVDLTEQKLVEVKADLNFPTALAKEEVQRTTELAELLEAPWQVKMLAVIDTVPTSPTYGHRLVAAWRDVPRARKVLVDLSTDAVIKRDY